MGWRMHGLNLGTFETFTRNNSLGTFTWNFLDTFGAFTRNLHLEPRLEPSEPFGPENLELFGHLTRNNCLGPQNLRKLFLEPRNPHLEPLEPSLGTSEPSPGTFGTFTWTLKLGTFWTLDMELLLGTPEPSETFFGTSEPSLGTF